MSEIHENFLNLQEGLSEHKQVFKWEFRDE